MVNDMKYYDAKDLVDLIAGKYKNDESILNSKETLEQLNSKKTIYIIIEKVMWLIKTY